MQDPRMAMAVQMLAQRMQRQPQAQPQQPAMPQMAGQGLAQAGGQDPPVFFGGQWIHPQDPRYAIIKQMILQKYQQGGAQGGGQGSPQQQMPGIPTMGGVQ